MRVRHAVVCACLLWTAPAPADEELKGDAKTIQGTWKLVAEGKPALPRIV